MTLASMTLASMTLAPVPQVYLDTVPMPSMEVYSGTPGDATQHFEDWMQTQYSPLTVQLGKWLDLSDNDKATEFLGQLNKYFEKRTALLGEEGTFLFPSRRPSPDALQVLFFCPLLMCTQSHTMRVHSYVLFLGFTWMVLPLIQSVYAFKTSFCLICNFSL